MKIKWNKVTWYSKIMALVLFVILPFYGFWLGTVYGGTRQYAQDMIAALQSVAAQSAVPATRVIQYIPVQSPKTATATKGSCWTNSIAAPFRADAWRCTVGNAIQDPCFAIPESANLLCGANPENPTAASTIVLSLTQPLPKPAGHLSPATAADGAWLIKLGDGTMCTPFTGTLPFSDKGDVAQYGCADGRMIFGAIKTEEKTWTAKVGTLDTASKTFPPPLMNATIVPVAAIWQ